MSAGIREAVRARVETEAWTDALEEDARGAEEEPSAQTARLSATSAIAARPAAPAVAPRIDGFGSLDTRAVPHAALSMAFRFADDFMAFKDCDAHFVPECLFSLLFFIGDVREVCGGTPRITSYIIGNARAESDAALVTVRFFTDTGFLDADMVLARQDDSSYKIEQVFLLDPSGGDDG